MINLYSKAIGQKYGEKTELKTLPGIHVWARKYSVAQEDEISQAMSKATKGLPKGEISKFMSKRQRIDDGDKKAIDELLDSADGKVFDEYSDIQNAKSEEIVRLRIRYGIGKHDFLADSSGNQIETENMSDEMLNWILQNADVAKEIAGISAEYNSPLPLKSAGASPTQQNGSSTDQNSSPTEESSQTDGTRQN